MQLQTGNLLREIDAKVASFSKMRVRFHSHFEERAIGSIIRRIIDAENSAVKCGYTEKCTNNETSAAGKFKAKFKVTRVVTNYFSCLETRETIELPSLRALQKALMTVRHRKDGITVHYERELN